VIVLKKILQKYNLNQPYSGGLNSYSLVLMTSAFLKHFGGVQSMSKNLQEILNYYGFFFNPQETIINASLDIISANMLLSDPMTVIDPHNQMNNVTRSAFRIHDIKGIFYRSFEYLMSHHNMFKMKKATEQSRQVVYEEDVIHRLATDAI
jgi:DNA polymerase sigma